MNAALVQARAPIRACMVSFYFHPHYSGSAVQAHNLSRHLVRRGVDPWIVSANLNLAPQQEELAGIKVSRLPVSKNPGMQVLSFWLSLVSFLVRNRRSFDIVHAHGTLQHGIVSLAGRLLGKKTILKIAMANSDIAFHRQGRLWGRVNRYLVSGFDRYIATSAEVYSECIERGLARERVILLPNGVDTENFRPAADEAERSRLRLSLGLPDEPIVSFVGIIDGRKNIDGILRVWSKVKSRGAPGHLVLIGPIPREADGSPSKYFQQLNQFLRDAKLEGTVTFTDKKSDVAAYLRCSNVFHFPSRQEGMPNVLLEAMSSGLACVASKISGTADIVTDGESGHLYELADEDGQADAIHGLLCNPASAAAFGAAARESIMRRFSLQALAQKYESLYAELLGEKRAGGEK
jgi:glycosyltransferase involved in cell wall biosynthesis